ncbi:MAG TPA: SDR family NAD(P)-dependent oxidoreductase, partial [Streptomyces sp.]
VLELGPDGSLSSLVGESGPGLAAVPALRRDRSEPEALLAALGEAHVHGIAVDWRAVFEGSGARRTDLPTYPFQHRRYWPAHAAIPAGALAAAGVGAADHPILRTWITSPETGTVIATGRISRATHAWIADHAVLGTPLLPGTGFVDLVCWAGERLGCPELAELTLATPLALTDEAGADVRLTVGEPDEDGRRAVAVHSRVATDDDTLPWTRHAEGHLAPAADNAGETFTLPDTGAESFPLDGFYPGLIDAGFDYGPAFQGLRTVLRTPDGTLYAEAELPEAERPDAPRFALHPALLDAVLHALGVDLPPDGAPRLPFAWTGVRIHAAGADAVRARIARAEDGTVTVHAVDAEGTPVVTVRGLVLRETQPAQAEGDPLYRITWSPLTPPNGLAPARTATLAAWTGETVDAVIAECPDGDLTTVTGHVLELLQYWLTDERADGVPLLLVTRRATPVPLPGLLTEPVPTPPDAAHAAAAGLVRAAQAEHPGRIVLVDTDGGELPVAALLAAGEPDLAVRQGRVLGRRLERVAGTKALEVPAGPWRLDCVPRGSFGDLALVPDPLAGAELAPGEVRIAVRAAGVNFRDTLIALDLYPGKADLGIEGAGVVLETGPGVTRFAVGDRVTGMLDGAFAAEAVADERLLTRVPDGWSFARAAATPVVFLTAWYGLVDLGKLQPGQRVLIHAGAGGVGTAAVQLARHLGAEVYATASRGKWDALRAAGLDDDHISSSRDTEFEERFPPVDVVLNCLAGEATDASLRLLTRGGRFVEMGKTDLRDPHRITADHPGVTYHPFDLADAGPDHIQHILDTLHPHFTTHTLTPPPTTTWPLHHAPDAFRALAQATLTGKAVLTLPASGFAAGETVLVTGGTGTLGALVARRLVELHGVRHLTLLSRGGPRTQRADALRTALTSISADVEVVVVAGDIGDPDAPARLHTVLSDLGLRLAAVVHCAGVTDDGALSALTPERLAGVLRPKAYGVEHLARLAELRPGVRRFVLFSSAAAALGSPGQANYAAANAFLDAYARRFGGSAVSVGWGLWETESALTAGLTAADHRRLRSGGFKALSDEEGLALFDAALTGAAAGEAVVAAPVDTAALRAWGARGSLPVLLRSLAGSGGGVRRRAAGESREPGDVLRRRLAALPVERRESALLALVRGEVAAVLGHAAPALIDAQRSFREMGFDSLTAVELRNRLNAATGLRLPATLVFDHPRLEALAAFVGGRLFEGAGQEPGGGVRVEESEARVRSLLLSVPLERLRESGLLDALLALAPGAEAPAAAGAEEVEEEPAERIASLDAASLVEMARRLSAGSV